METQTTKYIESIPCVQNYLFNDDTYDIIVEDMTKFASDRQQKDYEILKACVGKTIETGITECSQIYNFAPSPIVARSMAWSFCK